MKLSELRSDYEVKVRDANNRILTDAQYLELLNQGCQEWQNRTEELRRETALATTVKQFDYAAPTDIIKLIGAIWMPTESELEVLGPTEAVRFGAYGLRHVGTPSYIWQDENNGRLRIYPAAPESSATTTISDAGGISSSDATIGAAATSSFRSPAGWMDIESEKILYQNTSSAQFLLCRRGMGGTTAATHADSTAITECNLHLIYSYFPAAISADTDEPAFNERWHRYLNWYVLATALKLDGRATDAAAAEAKWEQGVAQAKRSIKRVQSGSPFGFMSTGY